jgi:hypothetical protein
LLPGIGGGGGGFGLWDGRVASERAKGIEREEVVVFLRIEVVVARLANGENKQTQKKY